MGKSITVTVLQAKYMKRDNHNKENRGLLKPTSRHFSFVKVILTETILFLFLIQISFWLCLAISYSGR